MTEGLVARAGLPFLGIPAGGMHGVGLSRALRNVWRLAQGLLASWRALRSERPAALLTTGGYVSGPVAVAAWLRRVPILLFLPDIEPGQSFRFIGRLAARIGVTVEDSRAFFPAHKVVVTGYPLRAEVTRWERTTARQTLGLSSDEAVLLVFGGSRGARSINRALLAHLSELLAEAQVVHISGRLDWEEVAAAQGTLPETLRARYHPFPYLHEEMGAALASADVVVSRAGASVLGEFPYFGLPAILVPYPYAWRYQKINAEWLARRGAALVVKDAQLPERLVPTVRDLLNDEAQRVVMAEAARSLARPDAAQQLANLLLSLGKVV